MDKSESATRIGHIGDGSKTQRLAVVDYIKAVCIVFVICHHSDLLDKAKPIFLLTIDKAVPIFMILSGYVAAIAAGRKTMKEMYAPDRMGSKFLRYTVPTLIAYAFWLVWKRLHGHSLTLFGIIKYFCLALYYRNGSYYYALMVQFLLISPILIWVVKRLGFHGVILAGLFNLGFDLCSSNYGLLPSLYRILVFRYLLALALGVYLGLNKDLKIEGRHLVMMLAVGLIYILLPPCWGYSYRIFTYKKWGKTSMISMFYVFPIIYIILRHAQSYQSRTAFGKTVEKIGQASYHIMYAQMIYYFARSTFDSRVFDISRLGSAAELFVNIIISISTGMLLYYLDERYVTGKLVLKLRLR